MEVKILNAYFWNIKIWVLIKFHFFTLLNSIHAKNQNWIMGVISKEIFFNLKYFREPKIWY